MTRPAGRSLTEDPRVDRSRRVILSAALEVLGEVGYGGLTIEAVAARAGAGKSTIYRHWAGKLELVEDAIRTLRADFEAPATGPVRERVAGLLCQVAARLADSTWSSCLPAIIDAAERDAEVMVIHRRFSAERLQVLVDLLAGGVATGELAGDLDPHLAAECLIGTLMVRRLFLHEPFDPAAVPGLVRQVLGDARPPTA